MELAASPFVKWLSAFGLLVFSLLLSWLFYQESFVWPRGSMIWTPATPEYVHERYQRSYFNVSDAKNLRRLHNEEAIALIGVVICVVVLTTSRKAPLASSHRANLR